MQLSKRWAPLLLAALFTTSATVSFAAAADAPTQASSKAGAKHTKKAHAKKAAHGKTTHAAAKHAKHGKKAHKAAKPHSRTPGTAV